MAIVTAKSVQSLSIDALWRIYNEMPGDAAHEDDLIILESEIDSRKER